MTTGTSSRCANSSASWLAISPAPTMPTLVTGRASVLSGAPTGRLARFCTRSKAYSPARSSSLMTRSASASSSAANASSRVAVLAPLEQVERAVRRRGVAVRLGVGDGPAPGHGSGPRLGRGRPRPARPRSAPVSTRAAQRERLLQEVGRLEQRVGEPELERLLGLQLPVLVQRVVDDDGDRAVGADQVGQQVGAAPAGDQPEEALGQAERRRTRATPCGRCSAAPPPGRHPWRLR